MRVVIVEGAPPSRTLPPRLANVTTREASFSYVCKAKEIIEKQALDANQFKRLLFRTVKDNLFEFSKDHMQRLLVFAN